MKDKSISGNDDVSKILSKMNLSPEMLASVNDLYKELDKSRADLMDIYKRVGDDKARRYEKQIENLKELGKIDIEYLIRVAEKEDTTPEQNEEYSKKIAEKISDVNREIGEIIARANEDSDKDAAKAKDETARSDKQKIDSFGSIVSRIAGGALILAGSAFVVNNPKNPKTGAGLILVGLGCIGLPEARKLLPLLQSTDDVNPEDVIVTDAL